MKYFKGKSGIYFDRTTEKTWVIVEAETAYLINKNNGKTSKIKRYNLFTDDFKINRVAVKHDKDLVYICKF